MYKPTEHAVLAVPTFAQVQAAADLWRVSAELALRRLMAERQQVMEAERADPLRCGWEPPIWKVADALLGLPCRDAGFERRLQRLGLTWEEFSLRLRTRLGFRRPVTILLILGANRSSKTEYASKRCVEMAAMEEGKRVYAFHMSEPRSKRDHQPLFWKYLPPEYREQSKGEMTYVSYKRHTGFSQNSFILPNESETTFLNYKQDRDTALEGMEADLTWQDELVPPDWVETTRYRLATRGGKGIVTFTPIRGYSPTVKIFCDGAETVRSCWARLLPKDGGEPDLAGALGLEEAELREVLEAGDAKRAAHAPQSRPEEVWDWLTGDGHEALCGREFHEVPRVMRCVDPELAVLFFHGRDNPFGNPKEVFAKARGKGHAEIRVRCYGVADRSEHALLARFNVRVHRLPAVAAPLEGRRTMLMDPAADRNFFLLWMLETEEHDYAYREWPSGYEVPVIGVPDPWAVPSGRKEGRNDGARAGGQASFGWGLLRYKFEIARLEGWRDFDRWLRDAGGPDVERGWRAVLNGELYPDEDELLRWDEEHGARERMEARIVDSRAASNPRVENDRPVTLYEDLKELGMDFELAPGSGLTDGVGKIATALDYDGDEELGFVNSPRLLVSDACVNLLFAMENWMGVDGEHGATKDPIDLLRYFYTRERTGVWRCIGGMHYGAGRTGHGRGEPEPPPAAGRRRPAVMDGRGRRRCVRRV